MKKLLLSGLILAATSPTALAAVPLTEQQMDTVTAGDITFAFATSGGFALSSITVSTDLLSAVSIAVPGTTLVGSCAQGNCTFSVNGGPKSINVCSTCTVAISGSDITVTDASGHIWDGGPASLQANPTNPPQKLQVMRVSAK
jgi:hypothetical protein